MMTELSLVFHSRSMMLEELQDCFVGVLTFNIEGRTV